MSATSQVTTFSDLYTDLQNRVRVETGVTATENQAKRYINIALQDMHVGFGEKFWWSHRDTVLRTHDDYTTGTVTVTIGSTTLTGSSTLWNTANDFSENNVRVGGKMSLAGTSDVYEVTAVASDTSLTLNTAYVNSTESGAGYRYFEDEYELASDFLRPLDYGLFSSDLEIPLISRRDFKRLFVRNNTLGRPSVATLIEKGPSGSAALRRRVRFHRPPDREYLIPYGYITNLLAVSSSGTGATALSGDTDEPIIPLQYRHVIVFHALYHWYRDKKDDTRSNAAKAEYEGLVSRITGDTEIGAARPRLTPRSSPYRTRAWPRTHRYVLGTWWDEFR